MNWLTQTYIEKHIGAPSFVWSIFYFSLFDQVFCRTNTPTHPHSCQKSCKISCVRWYNDESEEPPHTCNYATRNWPRMIKEIFVCVHSTLLMLLAYTNIYYDGHHGQSTRIIHMQVHFNWFFFYLLKLKTDVLSSQSWIRKSAGINK